MFSSSNLRQEEAVNDLPPSTPLNGTAGPAGATPLQGMQDYLFLSSFPLRPQQFVFKFNGLPALIFQVFIFLNVSRPCV